MGLFGGGNSKTSNEYNTLNENDQLTTDDGVVMGRDSFYSVTDAGQTRNALNFGRDSLDFAEEVLQNSFGFGEDALNGAFDAYDNSSDKAYEFSENSFSKMIGAVENSYQDSADAVFDINNSAVDKIARAYDTASKADSFIDPKYLWFGVLGITAIILLKGV